jgi:hypothetical protein
MALRQADKASFRTIERSALCPELPTEFALDAKPPSLKQCAVQDGEERAKWAEYVKIARIEAQ